MLIVTIMCLYSFFLGAVVTNDVHNKAYKAEIIDREIRQEYVNGYKYGGFYYNKAVDEAFKDKSNYDIRRK